MDSLPFLVRLIAATLLAKQNKALILRDREGYPKTLGIISTKIMPFVEYAQDPRSGTITIRNQTADLYR